MALSKTKTGPYNDPKATQKKRASRKEKMKPTSPPRPLNRKNQDEESEYDGNAFKNVFHTRDHVTKKRASPPKKPTTGCRGKNIPELYGDLRPVGSFSGGRGESGVSWRKGEDNPKLLSSVRETPEPYFPPAARASAIARAPAPAPALSPSPSVLTAMSKNVRKPKQLQDRRTQDPTMEPMSREFSAEAFDLARKKRKAARELKAAAAADENASVSDEDRGPRPSMTFPVRPGASLTHFAGYTPEKDKVISDNDSLFGIGYDSEFPRALAPTGNHSAGTSKLKADRAAKDAKRTKALLGPVDPKVPKPRGEAAAKVTKPALKPAAKPASKPKVKQK